MREHLAETAGEDLNNPPIRGYSARTGKSPLERECVVGQAGLEPPSKRLGALPSLERSRITNDSHLRARVDAYLIEQLLIAV